MLCTLGLGTGVVPIVWIWFVWCYCGFVVLWRLYGRCLV